MLRPFGVYATERAGFGSFVLGTTIHFRSQFPCVILFPGCVLANSSQGRSGPAGTYASALFELAVERDVVASVETDLATLVELIKESADLRRVVHSPVLARTVQARAMDAVLEAVGVDPLVRNFGGILARNRRLPELAAIAEHFHAFAADRRGETEAIAESAVALSDDLTARIEETISSALGRKAVLRASVNPELLGGVLVRVGSTLVDGSLRTKLRRAKHVMKGAA